MTAPTRPGRGNKTGALLMIGGAILFFGAGVAEAPIASAAGVAVGVVGLVVFVVARFRE